MWFWGHIAEDVGRLPKRLMTGLIAAATLFSPPPWPRSLRRVENGVDRDDELAPVGAVAGECRVA